MGVGWELVPVLGDADGHQLRPVQREGAGDESSAASFIPVAECCSQQMDFSSRSVTVREERVLISF